MPTFRHNQTSFAAGAVGGLLRGRVDLQQYPVAAEELTNIRVSGQVAYMLFFHANGTIQFYRNRARLLDSGAAPLAVIHPYAAGDLAQLTFAQSADVLYIFHPNHQPRKLRRTSASTFELALVELAQGPYDVENFGDVPPAATPPDASDPEDTAPPPAPGGDGSGDGPDPRQGNSAEGGGANGGEGSGSVGTIEWGGGETGAEAESGDTGGEIGPGGTTGLEG